MAKASAVLIRQTATMESIEARLERIEAAVGAGRPMATFEVSEAIEGDGMWGYTQDEMQSLLGTVEQLCNKAGVPWETLDLAQNEADPIAHVQSRLELLVAWFDMVPPPQNGDQPVPPPTVESGKVGHEGSAPTDMTPPPDTSGLSGSKNKNK